ncbi:hypothetical protein C8A03DRAFT_43000 [Achaetomium macrosporum]|uniref:Copper acquisition factor BIM1-like domain-containing protein n=1 Tax=Achaetomium macrosporum TaxID=79813 RepID=A0AAN7CE97_9PEZI|nr:hypothetical protein C8A03DRAFT_43000 [Achaetomium macrosporum]
MAVLQSTIFLAMAAGVLSTSADMGPAAIMWPPDRAWSAQADNTAPCGSVASVTNRTEFPLTGGKVAFVAQDDSYNTEISISFNNDPKSQSDFTALRTAAIPELDPGHTCVSIPDPPATVGAGANATIQIKYTADFDRPENQTFYACADITYVTAASFNQADVPCFNATEDIDVPAPTTTGTPTNLPGHGDEGPPLVEPGTSATATATVIADAGSKGLSKGGIAGAVVGSVVGFALVVGLGLLFYRERERKKRLVRQRDSAIRVGKAVDGGSTRTGNDSVSGESIRMGNLSR